MRRLVIATRNRGKLREIAELLRSSGLDVSVCSLDEYPEAPEVEETGATFPENAAIKARSAAEHANELALADDSGLVVDALGGAPGVMSARYAGPGASDQTRYERLLREMEHVPDGLRTARFVCAVAVAVPHGRVAIVEGSVEGVIEREPRGEGGFGYDPVFFLPELGATFGELDSKAKNAISHRARALTKSIPLLREALDRGSDAFDSRRGVW
ncbi:MAG: XTP/dITP diphosphatase [Clostridia bacterium]|nr:XTP/dITP diphosphatase [Clostridia bacterium]